MQFSVCFSKTYYSNTWLDGAMVKGNYNATHVPIASMNLLAESNFVLPSCEMHVV